MRSIINFLSAEFALSVVKVNIFTEESMTQNVGKLLAVGKWLGYLEQVESMVWSKSALFAYAV